MLQITGAVSGSKLQLISCSGWPRKLRDHICVERPSLHSLQHSPYAGFHPFACIWLLAVNDLTHSLQKFSFLYLQKQKSGMNFFPQTGAVLFLLIITGKLEHSLKLFFCPVKGQKCHWLTLKICIPCLMPFYHTASLLLDFPAEALRPLQLRTEF